MKRHAERGPAALAEERLQDLGSGLATLELAGRIVDESDEVVIEAKQLIVLILHLGRWLQRVQSVARVLDQRAEFREELRQHDLHNLQRSLDGLHPAELGREPLSDRFRPSLLLFVQLLHAGEVLIERDGLAISAVRARNEQRHRAHGDREQLAGNRS